MPPGRLLAHADVAMVNTETVLADDRTGLVRQPKAYNFVAPTRLLDVLHRAGVDVVTVANNHGEDYGLRGLERTLAARSASRPRLIGAGADLAAAFAPARVTVRGRGVVFFAATDVVDDGLSWAATATRPGPGVDQVDRRPGPAPRGGASAIAPRTRATSSRCTCTPASN